MPPENQPQSSDNSNLPTFDTDFPPVQLEDTGETKTPSETPTETSGDEEETKTPSSRKVVQEIEGDDKSNYVIAEEDPTISFDDFKKDPADRIVKEPTPAEPKTETPTTPEESIPEESTPAEDTKAAPVEQVEQERRRLGRNFDGLDESEKPYFVKMSNEAYNYLYPKYLEHKKVQQKLEELDIREKAIKENELPPHYYQHPEAYKLDKRYENLVRTQQTGQQIAGHWQQQLQNIKSGKPFQNLEFNSQTGSYQLTQPVEVTPENQGTLEAAVIQQLIQTNTVNGELKGELNALQQKFQSEHKNIDSFISDVNAKYFPMYQDEKAPVQPHIKALALMFPKPLQNDPLMPTLARSLYLNLQYLEHFKKQNNKEKVQASIKDDQRKAGPTNRSFKGGGNGGDEGNKKVFSWEDFNKIKAGVDI